MVGADELAGSPRSIALDQSESDDPSWVVSKPHLRFRMRSVAKENEMELGDGALEFMEQAIRARIAHVVNNVSSLTKIRTNSVRREFEVSEVGQNIQVRREDTGQLASPPLGPSFCGKFSHHLASYTSPYLHIAKT